MRYILSKEEIQGILNIHNTPELVKNHVQTFALYLWNSVNKRGTFEGATGVGKSRVGVLAVLVQFSKNPDSIVYVFTPTTSLRDHDWPAEFKRWGAGHLLPKIKIMCHVAMNEVLVEGEVDLVIFDEVHHATIDNCSFFTKNKVWDILGLSATLSDMEIEKVDLINKLCPSFFYLPVETAINLQLVTEFELIVLKFKLNDVDENVHIGIEEKTGLPIYTTEMKRYKQLSQALGRSLYVDKYKWAKFRNMQRRVEMVMNLPTKKILAREVLDQIISEGKRTLVFCGSIDQANSLGGNDVYHSSNKAGLKPFIEKKINTLFCVNALNEGKNLPDVDQSFVIQLNSKSKNLIQRIGRNIRWRLGHVGKIIILIARDTADEKWYKNAIKEINPARIKEYNIIPKDKS